ncbi:MAG: metallophosphoesterase family protein [Solirubrobacterales bacterium]|nr:metallophosphoesterase family protein [Solirubrobacterales bacterium]OJU95487.1 MAG: serine/threonine protein phosphatase [Solirubrobacterales bacterium 67-14]
MKILAFSDLHRDLDQAARLTEMSKDADVVIGAGDFASIHEGLEETIAALAGIEAPTVLVAGNNETLDALKAAAVAWPAATVLHGDSIEIGGRTFFGLGGGIPVTPWDWSYDLEETEAEALLADLPEGAVLVVHSPPKGHCDEAGNGMSLGSQAILKAIEEKQPVLAVCGHIHESWGKESRVGATEIVNLGPRGRLFNLG